MELEIKRIMFAILIIVTCIIIFIFSSQDAEKSGLTSSGFIRKIIEITRITNDLNEEEKETLIESCQFVVRKLAHFSIYAILGINTIGFVSTYKNLKLKTQIIVTVLFGAMYALSDEFHQMFSNGRTASLKDVCIDSVGVLFGVAIFLIMKKTIKKLNTKKLVDNTKSYI